MPHPPHGFLGFAGVVAFAAILGVMRFKELLPQNRGGASLLSHRTLLKPGSVDGPSNRMGFGSDGDPSHVVIMPTSSATGSRRFHAE